MTKAIVVTFVMLVGNTIYANSLPPTFEYHKGKNVYMHKQETH